jgi:hypothetical protein
MESAYVQHPEATEKKTDASAQTMNKKCKKVTIQTSLSKGGGGVLPHHFSLKESWGKDNRVDFNPFLPSNLDHWL